MKAVHPSPFKYLPNSYFYLCLLSGQSQRSKLTIIQYKLLFQESSGLLDACFRDYGNKITIQKRQYGPLQPHV